jgi:MFS family permease
MLSSLPHLPNRPSAITARLEASTVRRKRRLVWLVGLSHATNHFVMLIFPAVLLLVRQEFDLGYAVLGLFANVALLAYGMGALPAGILADRLGGTRILAIWLLGGSLACIAIGMSTGPANLIIGLAALGLFGSLHHPAGSGILVALRNVEGVDVGRAFGLTGVLGNIGLAASPVIAAMVAVRWGWRAAYLVGAIPGLCLALPLWQCQEKFLRGAGGPPLSPAGRRAEVWSSLTLPLLILFAVETLMGFVFQGFSTFLPAYLSERAQIPGLTASRVGRGGSIASLVLLFGGLGHLLAGRLMATRYREAIFLIGMVGTALALFGMGVTAGLPLILFSILLSLGHFSLGTISNTFIAFHSPPHLGGTAFGITFTLALGVGSLASSAMGLVGQRFGLPAVFLTLGMVTTGAVVLVCWFAHVVGGWWQEPTQPAAPPLPSSRLSGR